MTQAIATATTYDDFDSPALDRSRWDFLDLPRGDRRVWRCEEPQARTDVGEGTLDMHVDRFSRGHDRVQIYDDLKHQLLSTRTFAVPAAGRVTYSVEVAATNLGQTVYDWRDGQATFTILDPASGWSFRTCTTGHNVFAVYEPMRAYTTADPESVLEFETKPTIRPGLSHRHEVTLDFTRRSIHWRLDETYTKEITDCVLPGSIRLGLGITTFQPILWRRSQSLRGQGLSASFGPVGITTE